MSKMKIMGYEGMQGTGKTSGKPYQIGRLHTLAPLAEPMDGGIARGEMGTTYDCPLSLIEKIQSIQTPFIAEVDIRDIMKFGKREQQVTDIVPSTLAKS